MEKILSRTDIRPIILSKAKDLAELFKIKLTIIVVLSSALGYLIAGTEVNYAALLLLCSGGLLTVGAANGINQVIERQWDRLMVRTQNRPVAQGRMAVSEALIISSIAGIAGFFLLSKGLNQLSGLLALASLLIYAFAYTPLKRYTPLSVVIGAVPGAIPPLLGYSAATGYLDEMAWMLFALQFVWQFPHFWAIAWVLHDDYTRAGYKMLPTAEPGKKTAWYMTLFSLPLLAIPVWSWMQQMNGTISIALLLILGVFYTLPSVKLITKTDLPQAKKVMFASFAYLPLALIVIWLFK